LSEENNDGVDVGKLEGSNDGLDVGKLEGKNKDEQKEKFMEYMYASLNDTMISHRTFPMDRINL